MTPSEAELRIRALENELQVEREKSSVARSHHADDYEKLRTRIVRQLTTQEDLLTSGLHAMRNDRRSIADEFVDRALTAITGAIVSLKL